MVVTSFLQGAHLTMEVSNMIFFVFTLNCKRMSSKNVDKGVLFLLLDEVVFLHLKLGY